MTYASEWLSLLLHLPPFTKLIFRVPNKIIITYTTWCIWFARSKNILEGVLFNLTLENTIHLTFKYWFLAGKINPRKVMIPLYVKWNLPLGHNIMLNIDSRTSVPVGFSSMTGVLRNNHGDWVLGFMSHIVS